MARGAPEDGSGGRRPVPPLPRSLVLPGGAVEGEAMLRELPSAVATLVWETFRHLRMWALTPPARRGELFRRGSQELRELFLLHQTFDLDLTAPLAVLVRGMAPGEDVSPRDLSWACSCLSDWALGRDARGTALAYMELAALCAPENPGAAYVAGRLFRSYGEFRQAERWLQRARVVAWRVESWEVHALALIGLGNLHIQRGDFQAALQPLGKALRTARRHDLKEQEGMALHDLFVVAAQLGRAEEAQERAGDALAAYRTVDEAHGSIPLLAHDVACAWMDAGEFSRALRVFQALLPHLQEPPEGLRLVGNLAHAAGASGNRDMLQWCWIETWPLVAKLKSEGVLAASLLQLAYGAAGLSDWHHAEEAAARALEVGLRRGEANVVARAEELVAAVRERRYVEKQVRIPAHPRVKRAADELADDFVRLLEGRSSEQ